MKLLVPCMMLGFLGLAGCGSSAPAVTVSPTAAERSNPSPSLPPANRSPSSPQASTSAPGTVSRTLHLVAIGPGDNPTQGRSSIQAPHFVVVAQDGTIAAQRDGNGDIGVTVSASGFWSGRILDMKDPIGEATVFASASGYRDAIELHVLVSPSIGIGNEVVVPMQPVVQGTRNEPSVSDGSIHHLEIVGLADHYLHPTPTPHASTSAS